MSGTPRSSAGRAASALGITTDEYVRLRSEGLRHCTRCRVWHPEECFGLDAVQGRRRICSIGPWRVS